MKKTQFRAWHRADGMIYFGSNVLMHMMLDGSWYYADDQEPLVELSTCGYHFMRSTGITDTHDKEIFEGDILENEFGRRASVRWDFRSLAALQEQSHRATIIGNIYETPELLEKEISKQLTEAI